MDNTLATDIKDDTEIDIVLQTLAIEQRPAHRAVTRSVHCRDRAGNGIRLNEFEQTPLEDTDLVLGAWYALENVVGDVFRGSTSVATGYNTSATPIARPDSVSVGAIPTVPPTMVTAADVADQTPLNITARVDEVEPFADHDQIAERVWLSDVAGDPLQLTVFVDNDDVRDISWETGSWYRFGSVLGDRYRGQVGFTPTASTEISPVSQPVIADQERPTPQHAAQGGQSTGEGAQPEEPLRPETSDCPRCGATVKLALSSDDTLPHAELTATQLAEGTFFACPACQIAWDHTERQVYEYPLLSAGPSGALRSASTGADLDNRRTSTFRLLGYVDGDLMLRDVGDMPFARAEGLARPDLLKEQLGPVYKVKGAGYPQSTQYTLDALRSAYCIEATIGEHSAGDGYAIDPDEPIEIVEAVPVDYALEVEQPPDVAEDMSEAASDELLPEGEEPYLRQSIARESGPEADVYVFARELTVDGVPLLQAMQQGVTEHLEKFTTNFTGGFTGEVADVIFVVPSNRPYFAVYVLSEACLDLAHDLRAMYDLPPAHRGWQTNPSATMPLRYNPQYLQEESVNGDPALVPVGDQDGWVNLATGEATGADVTMTPQSNDLRIHLTVDGEQMEVGRVRPPSARQ